MQSFPRIVVITLNYNHSKDTLACIESILNSTYTNFHLLVIDNGSEIEDYEFLCAGCSSDIVKVIRQEPNIGYVGGVNLGLEEGRTQNPDYYLIMNNDTILDKNALNELIITAQKYDNQAIISGKVYNIEAPETLQYIGQECKNKNKLEYPALIKGTMVKDIGQFDYEIELGMADDIFWLLPKNIFEIVGYYSTDFFIYGEQNDYALRAIENGFKLVYSPKAKIWHYHHLTTSGGDLKSNKVLFWKSYAELLLAYKHLSKWWFIHFYLSFFVKNIIKFLLSGMVKKDFRKKQKTKLTALKYFTVWLWGKRIPNNGFNPIS